MATKTQAANIALTRIGVTKQIANVDTESSTVAIAVRQLIDEDVKFCLRDFPWPFATTYDNPALVAGSTSENAVSDWRYAYRYPSDALYIRRIVVPSVGRNNPNPPPFRIGRDAQGKLIYTNEPDAEIEYTYNVTDFAEFDSLFISQLAWKLAAGLGPSQSRIADVAKMCMQAYMIDKSIAETRALNEGQQEEPIESEAIRARD